MSTCLWSRVCTRERIGHYMYTRRNENWIVKRWRSICSVWALAMTNRCSIRWNLDIEDCIGRRWPFTAQKSITSFFGCFKFQYWCHRWWSSITLSNSFSFHLCEVRSLVGSRIGYSFLRSIFHTRLDKHRGRKKIRMLFSSKCYISTLVRKAH